MQEFTFEYEDDSDATVHYQDASFHLHKYVLITMSKYFKTVLSREALCAQEPSCTQTVRCRLDHHQCLVLKGDKEGQLGGVDVSVDVLHDFFRHIYVHEDGTGEWKKKLESEISRTKWPTDNFFAIFTAVDPTKDEVIYDCYRHDGVISLVVKGMMSGTAKASARPVGFIAYNATVQEHLHYHLSDYFQCEWLCKMYEKQALLMVSKTRPCFHAVWRLLRLADRYHWPEVRTACIVKCAEDVDAEARPEWKDLTKDMKPETLQEVILALYRRMKSLKPS